MQTEEQHCQHTSTRGTVWKEAPSSDTQPKDVKAGVLEHGWRIILHCRACGERLQ